MIRKIGTKEAVVYLIYLIPEAKPSNPEGYDKHSFRGL